MEKTSEVILRNEQQLGSGAVLLINPPRDTLFKRLEPNRDQLQVSTQDFGSYRWLQEAGARVTFDLTPPVNQDLNTVILNLPREKGRLEMMLHILAAGMPRQARLWLVGENRAGIKSAPSRLKKYFRHVKKLDSARHCSLFEASSPNEQSAARLEDYTMPWQVEFAGSSIELLSLPGVFAQGRLDKGTALLLEVIQDLRLSGKIVDFACGSGVIGISLLASAAKRKANMEMTMLDTSSLALESTRMSLAANSLNATVLPSDGLSELAGRFDAIVSNPPFHSGVANDLNISSEFFRRAGTFLKEKGRILVVFNRHLPYSRWMREHYENVECLAGSTEYTIIQASRPIKTR